MSLSYFELLFHSTVFADPDFDIVFSLRAATIYTTARNIIPAIELELKTPLQTASGIRLKSQARCLSLMALVVVVVKMRYGLDGEKR